MDILGTYTCQCKPTPEETTMSDPTEAASLTPARKRRPKAASLHFNLPPRLKAAVFATCPERDTISRYMETLLMEALAARGVAIQ